MFIKMKYAFLISQVPRPGREFSFLFQKGRVRKEHFQLLYCPSHTTLKKEQELLWLEHVGKEKEYSEFDLFGPFSPDCLPRRAQRAFWSPLGHAMESTLQQWIGRKVYVIQRWSIRNSILFVYPYYILQVAFSSNKVDMLILSLAPISVCQFVSNLEGE